MELVLDEKQSEGYASGIGSPSHSIVKDFATPRQICVRIAACSGEAMPVSSVTRIQGLRRTFLGFYLSLVFCLSCLARKVEI